MQRTIGRFLRALRASEIPISPAEAIDAHTTVDMVGYADRTLLKDALCAALAKSADEVERFDKIGVTPPHGRMSGGSGAGPDGAAADGRREPVK